MITIIVLLILAGISISMLSGDNSILNRASISTQNTKESQIREKMKLAYNAVLASEGGNVTEKSFAKELTKAFGARNVKYTLIDSKDGKSWIVATKGSDVKENFAKPTNLQTAPINPEEEYGYVGKPGVIDASTLVEGDIINYYYDATKEPISCAVLFNDNEHGLEVIPLDSIQDVLLGYNDASCDTKALEAFINGVPEGYSEYHDGVNKAIWSYNHAFQTLKEYAMDYIGNMAINVRCIGAPDNIQIKEMDLENMSTSNLKGYSYTLKNEDNYYQCDELNKMNSLGILKCATQNKQYWIASRVIIVPPVISGLTGSSNTLNMVDENGDIKASGAIMAIWYNESNNKVIEATYAQKKGFRPIFTLRDDIKIEKTGILNP